MKANEEWRNDPHRIAAARRKLQKETTALKEVHSLLTQAYEVASAWGPHNRVGRDDYLANTRSKIFSALYRMDWWVSLFERILREDDGTYLGNMAAFGEGDFETVNT